MDDLEYRRQVVINPFGQDDGLNQHKGTEESKRFAEEQQIFEQQLRETLNVEVPDNLAEKILFKQVSKVNKIVVWVGQPLMP